MQLDQTFTQETLPEAQSFELIKEGWYEATVTKADLQPTKNGTGQRINVQYNIIGPTAQGRVVFGGLNIRNANPKAQEIGLGQLNTLMKAVGLTSLSDTDQLIGHSCEIKVKVQPAKDGYEAKNDVSGWKAIAGGKVPTINNPIAQTATGELPPWKR